MYVSTLVPVSILALLATKSVLAQDVDTDEIPSGCAAICSNISQVSDQCDTAFESDADETRCMCNSVNAQLVIPLCAACVSAVGSDGEDNDVQDLVVACSFTRATYNPDATYSQAQMTAATATSMWTMTTASGNNPATTNSFTEIENTPPATSVTPAATPSTTIDVASSASAQSESAASASPTGENAAPSNKIQGVSAFAGAALLLAAAWL